MAHQAAPTTDEELVNMVKFKLDFIMTMRKHVEKNDAQIEFLQNMKFTTDDTYRLTQEFIEIMKTQNMYSEQVVRQGWNSIISDGLNRIETSTVPDFEEDEEKEQFWQFLNLFRNYRSQA